MSFAWKSSVWHSRPIDRPCCTPRTKSYSLLFQMNSVKKPSCYLIPASLLLPVQHSIFHRIKPHEHWAIWVTENQIPLNSIISKCISSGRRHYKTSTVHRAPLRISVIRTVISLWNNGGRGVTVKQWRQCHRKAPFQQSMENWTVQESPILRMPKFTIVTKKARLLTLFWNS